MFPTAVVLPENHKRRASLCRTAWNMSHTIVHSAENGEMQVPPTCLLVEWRLSLDLHYYFGFRCPVFISCLRVCLLWMDAFQVFHSLHTNAEMTPKIRPRPLPSAVFPINFSLIIQPYDAVRGHEFILIKFFCFLFNDAAGSPDYTRAMTGWFMSSKRVLKEVALSRNFPRETD